MQPRERLADVRRRPSVYGLTTFDQLLSFMVGFDAATEWAFLQGFREWLASACGLGDNLAWFVLARHLVENSISPHASAEGEAEFDRSVEIFFDALERFLEDRSLKE